MLLYCAKISFLLLAVVKLTQPRVVLVELISKRMSVSALLTVAPVEPVVAADSEAQWMLPT